MIMCVKGLNSFHHKSEDAIPGRKESLHGIILIKGYTSKYVPFTLNETICESDPDYVNMWYQSVF